MNDAELEGFRPNRYFARSWGLLTRDRGWIKPILVMVAASFVPIVGPLGVLGYVVEWARLTAWGAVSSPKQKNVQVGACIASGWRVFVIMFVWALASSLITSALLLVPLFGPLLLFAWMIFSILLNLMVMIAALRATIYQRIGAGFRVSTIWQMTKSDIGGLMRILGMQLAGGAITSLVCGVISVIAFVALVPQIVYYADYISEFDAIMSQSMRMSLVFEMLGSFLTTLGPALVVAVLFGAVLSMIVTMLGYTGIALWMRQFNVPAWGNEEDPLPTASPAAGAAYGTYGYGAQPQQTYGYGYGAQPTQPHQAYGYGAQPAQQQAQPVQQPAPQPAQTVQPVQPESPAQPAQPAPAPEPQPEPAQESEPVQPAEPTSLSPIESADEDAGENNALS